MPAAGVCYSGSCVPSQARTVFCFSAEETKHDRRCNLVGQHSHVYSVRLITLMRPASLVRTLNVDPLLCS